jgi:excisionase family DNA binding protein
MVRHLSRHPAYQVVRVPSREDRLGEHRIFSIGKFLPSLGSPTKYSKMHSAVGRSKHGPLSVEAGRALGLSPSSIDRLISKERIAACRIGRRVLICRSEIEKPTRPPKAAVSNNRSDATSVANDGEPFSKV